MQMHEKVKQYIDENYLKQTLIAQKAGIPKGTFNAMLNDKRTMYADDLRSICYTLNVSADTFIDITEYNETKEPI